jgi:hypothetical protein
MKASLAVRISLHSIQAAVKIHGLDRGGKVMPQNLYAG